MRKWIWILNISSLVACLGILGTYQFGTLNISYKIPLKLYWTDQERHQYAEVNAQSFHINTNQGFKEYNISLPSPADIRGLRLNLSSQAAFTALDALSILNAQGQVVQNFEFNSKDSRWVSIQSNMDKSDDGIWKVFAEGEEPFIMSPAFSSVQGSTIRLQLEADIITYIRDEYSLAKWLGDAFPEKD